MSEMRINGEINGADYFEFKGSVKEAIKFMHARQGTLEKGQGQILRELIDVRKTVAGVQVKVAGISAGIAFVVSVLVLLLRSLL